METAVAKRGAGTMRRALVFTTAAVLVWSAFGMIFLALKPLDILAFLFFQILCVVSPGLALYKLLGLRGSPLEALTYSCALGLAAIVAVYFLFAPFGAMGAIPWAMLSLAAASGFALWRLRGRALCADADGGELKIALIFCAFALAATALCLSGSMLSPALSGMRSYFHDTLNGAGLTVSAMRGFPMTSIQMSGVPHYYHIFYFAYNAVLCLCTGIPAYDATMFYSLVTISPLIAAAVVLVAKRILRSNRLTVFAAVLALVIPQGFMAFYLYQDTIAFPMGLALSILAVDAFLCARHAGGKCWNRRHTAALLFLLMATGAKGPLGVTVLFGVCFVLLVSLIRDKKLSVIPTGLLYAVPFLIEYVLLYSKGTANSMSWSPFYSAFRTPLYFSLAGRLPDFLAKLLSAVWYTVQAEPLVFASFLLLVIAAARRKKADDSQWFLLGGTLVSWALLNLFKQVGSSEIYFVLVLAPLCAVSTVQCAADLLRGAKSKLAKTVLAAVCAALLLPCAVSGTVRSAHSYWGDFNESYDLGLSAAIRYSRFADTSDNPIADRGKTITPAEYEAMVWLRDNTPQDAVVADGRYLLFDKYFCGSVFSERSFYLEGYGFMTMDDTNDLTPLKIERDSLLRAFFETGDEGFLPLMSRSGIDYLIVSECVNTGLELSDQYGGEVFRNEHVKIYKLNTWEE